MLITSRLFALYNTHMEHYNIVARVRMEERRPAVISWQGRRLTSSEREFMRIRNFLVSLLSTLILIACSPAKTAVVPIISPISSHTPEPTPTINQITPTATNTQLSESILQQQCGEVLSTFPAGRVPEGILVLSSPDGLSLLNFSQQTQREISGLIEAVGTSPDRKWLSYSNAGSENLLIESANGEIQAQVPLKQGWLTFNQGFWLDNEQLWFPIFPRIQEGEVAPMVLVNPFTGKPQEIPSDYPGIKRYQFDFSTSPGLHFGYSSVVFDPSLNLVIYPQEGDDGWYIVLWDRQAEKMIAKIPDGGLYGHMPLWLPDGNKFVVVARPDWDSPREWIMVSPDGEIRQLTHFEDLYSQFEIGHYASVSPDGRYLAFGLSQGEDTNSDHPKPLIILDLKTGEAIDTCITFSFPEPTWSPDSQYLAVLSRESNKPSSIVILDIEQNWAAKVSEDPKAKPVGWLKSQE